MNKITKTLLISTTLDNKTERDENNQFAALKSIYTKFKFYFLKEKLNFIYKLLIG